MPRPAGVDCISLGPLATLAPGLTRGGSYHVLSLLTGLSMEIHLHSLGAPGHVFSGDFRAYADNEIRKHRRTDDELDPTMEGFEGIAAAVTPLGFYDPQAANDQLSRHTGLHPLIQMRAAHHLGMDDIVLLLFRVFHNRVTNARCTAPLGAPSPIGPGMDLHGRRIDIAFLCRRGKHRSVALVELWNEFF